MHPINGVVTIADVLLSDGAKDNPDGFDRRWNDYDIATQATLLFPDLVAAASDPNANLTLLAPTDQAFRLLATSLTKKHYSRESDVFAAIAAFGADTVKAVLSRFVHRRRHQQARRLGPVRRRRPRRPQCIPQADQRRWTACQRLHPRHRPGTPPVRSLIQPESKRHVRPPTMLPRARRGCGRSSSRWTRVSVCAR